MNASSSPSGQVVSKLTYVNTDVVGAKSGAICTDSAGPGQGQKEKTTHIIFLATKAPTETSETPNNLKAKVAE